MPDKKEEEELTPVGEGAEQAPPADEEEEEEGKSKPTPPADEDKDEEEEEEEEEQRLGADDDEDDDKRARRKDERKTRRTRQKEARARDKKELGFQKIYIDKLEGRVGELEDRMGHSEGSQIDAKIAEYNQQVKLADSVIAKAITGQDGEAYSEAQGIRDNLRDRLAKLHSAKELSARQEQGMPDSRLVNHASSWMRDNSWWDPNGGDKDSKTVSRLDAQLVRENYDPTTSEYWEELSDRVEEALPHRFKNGEDSEEEDKDTSRKKKKRKSRGPTFSTGGRERPLKKGEVYISPERRAAMEEAGVWDDPEERQRYLKSYAKYDREAASNA